MNARLLILLLAACFAPAATGATPDRTRMIRERYEKVLARNPFQATAFARVYDGYVQHDGLDAWIARLKQADNRASRVVLARIYERQLDHTSAIKQLESLAADQHPQFNSLAGRIYYRTGDDRLAAKHLTAAVEDLRDLDERSQVCRMLGHIHLRQGDRAAAIEVWKRIVGEANDDVFALTELASIYEDNRMWEEAIGVYQRIIKGAANDPYRRCQARRQIGIAHLHSERHAEAIAAFEQAFDLVAPGNWMFDDLKQRLVSVYQDQGDLTGLLNYLNSRIEAQPGDLDFRLLRAETFLRLKRPDAAEQEFKYILERRPQDVATYENLISFYEEQDRLDDLVATYEKLIELYPSSLDYLRRLGEHHLRHANQTAARKTWQRALQVNAGAATWVTLAGWYADNEMSRDAIAAYESALKLEPQRDWMLQLADLKFAAEDRRGALELWQASLGPEPSVEQLAEIAMILDRHRLDDEADGLFRRVLNRNPDDHESRVRLARSLMRRRDYPAALKHFDILARQDESEYLGLQGERGQLEVYRRQGVLTAKQKEWEKQLAADTNSVALISRLISVHERNGRHGQALEFHRRLVQIEPDNTDHQRRLALALSRNGYFADSIKAFQQLAAKDRPRARVHLQELLHLYNRTFNRDAAIKTAEQIVSLAPTDPEVHLQLAETLARYQRNEEALAEFRKAANLNPEEPKYWQQYAELLRKEGKWNEAQLVYERMLDVSVTPDTRVTAVAGLTAVANEAERLDEFLSRLKSRLRKTPKKIEAYEDLAVAYRAAGRMEDALTSIEAGLPRVDDQAPMLRSLIRYSWEAKDFQRVRQYYQKLVQQRGKPGPFEYERLGQIHARLGEMDKALTTWRKIIDEYPDNLRALNRLVRVYEKEELYNEAIALRKDLLADDPDDRKGRYQYARLLVQAGEKDEAFEAIYRLLESSENAPTNTFAALGSASYPRIRIADRLTLSATYFGRDLKPYFRMTSSSSSRNRSKSKIAWSGSPGKMSGLIQDLARMAVHFKRKEEVIGHWRRLVLEDPENLRLHRGLVELYEGLKDLDGAVQAARAYAQKSPEDDEMGLKAALFLSHAKDYHASIELLDGVLARTNRFAPLAGQGKVAVLLAAGRSDEAVDFSRQFLAAEKGPYDSRSSIANLMKSKAKYGYARELYTELKDDTPTMADYADYYLGEISRSQGRTDEAIQRFTDLLFSTAPGGMRRAAATSLYVPRNSTYVNSFSSSSLGIPSHVVRISNYYPARALSQLSTLVSNFGNSEIFEKLEQRVFNPGPQLTLERRWDSAKMLAAWHLKEKRFDEILLLLDGLPAEFKSKVEWFNLKLFTHHMKLDFDAMEKVYSEFANRFPGNREVQRARPELDKARARKRAPMTYRSTRSSSLVTRSTPLIRLPSSTPAPGITISTSPPPVVRIEAIKSLFSRRKDLGIRLLTSELARSGRTPDLLTQLAKFQLANDQPAEAVKTITEAWERRKPNRARPTISKSFFLKSGDTQRLTIKIDPLLDTMNSCYREAKQLPQLYSLLAKQASAEPSQRARLERAHIYLLNQNLLKALDVFHEIAEKHKDKPEATAIIKRIKTALTRP